MTNLFIFKTILRKTIFVPRFFLKKRIDSLMPKYPNVLSLEETLDLVIDGYSLSRFGDGEIGLVYGKDIYFQKSTPKIAKELRKIIKIGRDDEMKFLCGIQKMKYGGSFWRKFWFFHGEDVINLLNRNVIYGNLGFSRHIDSKSFERFRDFLQDKKIIVVTGKGSKLNITKILSNNSYSTILTKKENAFEEYYEILDKIRKIIEIQQIQIVLLAVGPTASILSYDICRLCKVQALDIGHMTNVIIHIEENIPFQDK